MCEYIENKFWKMAHGILCSLVLIAAKSAAKTLQQSFNAFESSDGQQFQISPAEGDRTVACCSRLVHVSDFSEIPSSLSGQFGQLLSTLLDAARMAAFICTRAADVLKVTHSYTPALDKELAAFADLEVAQWRKLEAILQEASNWTSINAPDSLTNGKESFAFQFLGMLALLLSGSPLILRDGAAGGRSEASSSSLVLSTLPRFICASSASWLLDLRAFSLAAHLSCATLFTMAPCEAEALEMPMLEVVRDLVTLDLAEVSFSRKPDAVFSSLPVRQSSSEPNKGFLLLRSDAAVPPWTLLIYVAPTVPKSQVRAAASILKEALDRYGQRIHVVWFEHFFLRHCPYLVEAFREYSNVEVLWQPYFSLHTKDIDVWFEMSSLIRIHCSRVKCFFFDLPDHDVDSDSDVSDSDFLLDRPKEPGCWFRLPSGCHRDEHIRPSIWHRDVNGERHYGAGVEKDSCVELRREHYNKWCDVDDTLMHFVAWQGALDSRPDAIGGTSLSTALENLLQLKPPFGLSAFDGCSFCEPFLPPFGHVESAKLWEGYLVKHSTAILQTPVGNTIRSQKGLRDSGGCIIWACHPEFPCGGHGDRVKGMIATFIFALLTDRLFFIDAPDPWDIRLFLRPNLLDWRISGLRGFAGSRHILWDHDAFESSLLDKLLEVDDPVWIIYTNKKSLLGPLLRHPRLAARASELGLYRLPHLVYHVWNVLFRPAPALERRLHKLKTMLGGAGAPFIAMHHRGGDAGNFGIINGEVDRRSGPAEILQLLSCAHTLEHSLGLPNTTHWYLASDGELAQQIPQVAAWRRSGKLVLSMSTTSKLHIAAAGVLPPANHLEYSAQAPKPTSPSRNPSVVEVASSLAGVSDAWLDFLTLSSASAIALSSSAFGLMASQIGGLEHTYTSLGCTRVDLAV